MATFLKAKGHREEWDTIKKWEHAEQVAEHFAQRSNHIRTTCSCSHHSRLVGELITPLLMLLTLMGFLLSIMIKTDSPSLWLFKHGWKCVVILGRPFIVNSLHVAFPSPVSPLPQKKKMGATTRNKGKWVGTTKTKKVLERCFCGTCLNCPWPLIGVWLFSHPSREVA